MSEYVAQMTTLASPVEVKAVTIWIPLKQFVLSFRAHDVDIFHSFHLIGL